MVMEKPILPTWEWLWGGTDAEAAGAFFEFIKVALVLVLLGLILGLLVSIFR